jgi:hydrogenase expression/formation protein HypD
LTDFNDPLIARAILQRIRENAKGLGTLRIMEVCGTHSMAIGRWGIRGLIPGNIHLISGPGCPVCVTPIRYIDNAASLALEKRVTIATFGDMIRVPGVNTSLEEARANGGRIEVITSPFEIIDRDEETVLLAVGFETTAAPIAAVMKTVLGNGYGHISFYTSLKMIPPILKVLLADPEVGIDGLILPGHVSAVIGSDAYHFVSVPSVISGFDLVDILDAVDRIIEKVRSGNGSVVNAYSRVVEKKGNLRALEIIDEYLEPCLQPWRGMGELPGCSLRIRDAFSSIDAEKKYDLPVLEEENPSGCRCGEVLKGRIRPDQCPLFGSGCTPENPSGPCMVSYEGSCAAYYKYRS